MFEPKLPTFIGRHLSDHQLSPVNRKQSDFQTQKHPQIYRALWIVIGIWHFQTQKHPQTIVIDVWHFRARCNEISYQTTESCSSLLLDPNAGQAWMSLGASGKKKKPVLVWSPTPKWICCCWSFQKTMKWHISFWSNSTTAFYTEKQARKARRCVSITPETMRDNC